MYSKQKPKLLVCYLSSVFWEHIKTDTSKMQSLKSASLFFMTITNKHTSFLW